MDKHHNIVVHAGDDEGNSMGSERLCSVNFVYTEYSCLKPVAVSVPGDTVVSALVPEAERTVKDMLSTGNIALPKEYTVMLGMFSTLLPDYKDSSNTLVEELVTYGGHIIVEVQTKTKKGHVPFFVDAATRLQSQDGGEKQSRYESKLKDIRTATRTLQRDVTQTTSMNDALSGEIHNKRQHIETLMAEKEERTARHSSASSRLKDDIARAKEEYGSYAKQEAMLKAENSKLSQQLEAIASIRKRLEALLDEKALSVDEAQARYAVLREDVTRSRSVVDALEPHSTSPRCGSAEVQRSVQHLALENEDLRRQWANVEREFAVIQRRMEDQLTAQFEQQLKEQQEAFMQQLRSQLHLQAGFFRSQQETFRSELLSTFASQQESMECKASKMELTGDRLEREIDVLMHSLKTSTQQYQDLMQSFHSEPEARWKASD